MAWREKSATKLMSDADASPRELQRNEGEQLRAFRFDRGSKPARRSIEQLDVEKNAPAIADDLPLAADESVDEDGRAADLAHHAATMIVRDDAGSIGVRDENVVVLRQEADRRGDRCARPHAVRDVEQLA